MLARACAGEGMTSHYQPIVDVTRGSVVGYEALVRFTGYPVTDPEAWFAVARDQGWLAALEAAALRSALSRRADLPPNAYLTVNVGPDVMDDPVVQEALHSTGPLAGIVVELTEQAKVESYVDLEPVLDQIRNAGALISLDDAGSGYAGLTHMLHIRPAFIKLDRTLISGIDRDESKQALVEMMGTLGGRLDAWLVAEGVETRAELDTLVRLGVPLVQGYHLARPAPTWATVAADTALHLVTSTRQVAGPGLRSMVDAAVTATSVEKGREWLALDHVELVVVVDQHSHPVCTMTGDGSATPLRDTLCFNADTGVAEAAFRAVARPVGVRHEPLVCTDNAGRFVGVVRMENVVKSLAGSLQSLRLAGEPVPRSA